jgi:DNA polymerase III delta prime subunit
MGGWRVVVMEDADRLTESAANALLKAIEEPGNRTVWLLCAPTLHDVLPTIRSRCRHLQLVTPSTQAVAQVLQTRDGISPNMADFAARVSQGHIGRARYLAFKEFLQHLPQHKPWLILQQSKQQKLQNCEMKKRSMIFLLPTAKAQLDAEWQPVAAKQLRN